MKWISYWRFPFKIYIFIIPIPIIYCTAMKIRQLVHQMIGSIGMRHNLSDEYEKGGKDNNRIMKRRSITQDYPKIPSDFQCFVCGVRFDTNMDRLHHLEKEAHSGLYATGMPNDSEV